MSEIELTVEVDADVANTWGVLADLGNHHRWMADAVAIRFEGDRRSGAGTAFLADTRVGPLRTTDHMVVTDWVEERRMAVRHEGAVTGTGVFALEPRAGGGTTVRWSEQLEFPWWFGGRIGALVARPILARIWRRNLASLARLIDGGPAV